ncbi:MAG: hypothetical protein AAF231_14575 [Pseudomonadota bacterium]
MGTDDTGTRNIRTWADWLEAEKSGNCTAAERRLVEACLAGETCTVGDGDRPTTPTDANQIGADLLRYLIIGGCKDYLAHEWGVDVYGAFIKGALDLRLIRAVGVTGMINCHFDRIIDALNARLELLDLGGSRCAGLNAQGAEVKGDVFLRGGFVSKGEVRLSGAVIGGQLACTEGRFENEGGYALNAHSAEVKGAVLLRGGFVSKGQVSLSGAVIGGQLACTEGRFENEEGYALNAQGAEVKDAVFLRGGFVSKGEVSLSGAVIGGQLACTEGRFENEGGNALDAQGAEIGLFFWRGVTRFDGHLLLSGAKARVLTDDAASWGLVDRAYLDGFRYDTIHGPMDAASRLEWLDKACAYDGSFSPQPYEQLAWVLKRMGYNEQRLTVLIEKEKRLRKFERENLRKRFATDDKIVFAWLKDWGFRILVGYGYRPGRSLWALFILIAVGSFVAHQAYQKGDFAPNSDVILSTPEWQELAEGESANPAYEWSSETGKGRDYETFSPVAYAIDVVIPIVAIGQEAAWAPSTNRGPWGKILWVLRWILTGMGWLVTAVGAAAITGLIRRD